jgi:hypothetical protein
MNKLNTLALGLVVTLCACKGGGGESSDWSQKPLDQTIQDKVKGAGFRLQIPAGWKLDTTLGPKAADPNEITKEWRPDVKDYFSEPSVSVSYQSIPAKDLDGYIKDAMLSDKDQIAKKEQTADGFVLVTHTKNNGTVRARIMKAKGAVHIECRASQAKTGGVPNPPATMAWLEKMCATLTIE